MQDAHQETSTQTNSELVEQSPTLIPQGAVALAIIKSATASNGITEITLQAGARFAQTDCFATSVQRFNKEDLGKTVACVQPLGATTPLIMGIVLNTSATESSLLDGLLESGCNAVKTALSIEAPVIAKDVEIDLTEISAAELHQQSAELMSMEEDESDPERLILRAQQSVVIKCGESSISLEADGRIRLNGRNIFSRASQLQRIAGGAIKLN